MTLDAGGAGSRLQALRAGLTDNYGLIWTVGILLRIRRLGVRVPPSAPAQSPLPILKRAPLLPMRLMSRSEPRCVAEFSRI